MVDSKPPNLHPQTYLQQPQLHIHLGPLGSPSLGGGRGWGGLEGCVLGIGICAALRLLLLCPSSQLLCPDEGRGQGKEGEGSVKCIS